MAEIHIERKKTSAWMGIAALVVLALLLWAALEFYQWRSPGWVDARAEAAGGERSGPEAVASAGGAPMLLVVDPAVPVPATAAFLAHIRGEGEGRMGSDHLYTAEAISRMSDALREIVQARPGVNPEAVRQAGALQALAAGLVTTPDSLRAHADWMSQAALSAAAVMEGVADDVKGPVPEMREQAREARQAATAIDPSRDLLAQKDAVRAFFREMGDALAMLARAKT
ncbi:MAG: hypothetical protein KY444_12335 [Gemmatimonadetes bacterium]|nr:hypothetical protein [Gemmatimonadota bacterium]